MPVPDKHDGEPSVEVQDGLFADWLAAKGKADAWKKEEARLRAELLEQLGDATAGTVYGNKVVTYRPKAVYAKAAIIRDYPDLAQHYMRPETTDVFDIDAFVRTHRDIAEKYRVREFRLAVDLKEEESDGQR
jgi:hypothetical protein